jgi:LSD1 subclass zinc finger protein
MLHDLLAVLVPPLCAACLIPLPRAGDVVCGGCRRALPWLRGPQCIRCALPLTATHACPAARQAFDAAWAAVGYAGVARDLVAALKFRRARPLADVMAAQLAAGAPRSLLAGATIVPVPAHPAHLRSRGYDQAGLLAGGLARRTGAPLARPLRRRGPLRSQLGASRAERLERPRGGPGARGAGRRRAHDGRDARRVRPCTAAGGRRRGDRADLGACSPGSDPCRPRQVVR